MAITQTNIDNVKRYIGQGEIFVGVGKPTTGSALTMATGVPFQTDGTTPATSVGLTSGPAEVTYKADFKGVEIEQAYGEIAPRVTKESVQLKFKCAEATLTNIALAAQTGTVSTSGTGPVDHIMTIGGKTFFDTQCVAVVSPLGGGLFEYVVIYEALSVDGIKLGYKRGESRMVEVTLTGYADVTRPEGDQLCLIGQQSAS